MIQCHTCALAVLTLCVVALADVETHVRSKHANVTFENKDALYIYNKHKTFDYIRVEQHKNNLTINILPILIRPRPYKESYYAANLTVLDTIVDYVLLRYLGVPNSVFEDGIPDAGWWDFISFSTIPRVMQL